jgi:acyl dehydratase
MRTFTDVNDLAEHVGDAIGYSGWMEIDQAAVNLFADATHDHQWIHIDPERAAESAFGGTIAHGFLTLALLPHLWRTMYQVSNVKMGVNYGLNRVRFPAPVPVGSRIRAHSSIVSVEPVSGAHQVTLSTVVEVEGAQKPVCIAETIVRYIS